MFESLEPLITSGSASRTAFEAKKKLETKEMTHAFTKDLQLEGKTLEFEVPEKGEKYLSYVNVDGQPVFLQTPRVRVIARSGDDITVQLPDDENLKNLVRAVDERARIAVFEKSEVFFAGRRFSQDRISSAHRPSVTEDGQVTFALTQSTIVKNQYGSSKNVSDVVPGSQVAAVVRLDGAFFGKRSWELGYSASQVKLYMDVHPQSWNLDMTVDCRPNLDKQEADELISADVIEQFADDEDFYTDVENV